jgi:hypothetical protein
MASLVLPQPEKRALGRDTADGKSNLVEEPPTGWEPMVSTRIAAE